MTTNTDDPTVTAADLEEPLLVTEQISEILNTSPRHTKRMMARKDNPLPTFILPGSKLRRSSRRLLAGWIARGGQSDA